MSFAILGELAEGNRVVSEPSGIKQMLHIPLTVSFYKP